MLVVGAFGILYVTNLGVLVWRSAVEDRGEGGPSFGCYYLGTMGPVRIGYFYSERPDSQDTWPAPRSDCAWFCIIEKRTLRLGTREIAAWQCASE
jgi:hypothetical protein